MYNNLHFLLYINCICDIVFCNVCHGFSNVLREQKLANSGGLCCKSDLNNYLLFHLS